MRGVLDKITLSHGSGGIKSRELVTEIFAKHFSNPILNTMGDSAIVNVPASSLAFTTDAFVVKPLFFPGGDIGKLSICGTINDLAVSGAHPLYIVASFIIEEGIDIALLEGIVKSMAAAAREAGVTVVAGDTKVVEKGSTDTLFITTSGIGKIFVAKPIATSRIEPGDAILINGTVADHGISIMTAREGLSFQTEIQSDCAPLHDLVKSLATAVPDIHFMRDVTRGGLATVLNEVVLGGKLGIDVDEIKIPLRKNTSAVCEILGIDPLYVANEGKLVAIVPPNAADKALLAMQAHPLGTNAAIIGHVTCENSGKVSLTTKIGTKRIIAMMSGDQIPRIC